MTYEVLRYRIDDAYTGTYDGETYDISHYIVVLFDDATQTLSVDLQDSTFTSVGTPNDGPNLLDGTGSYTVITSPTDSGSYANLCQDTTLLSFYQSASWPYAIMEAFEDHAFCSPLTPVCDLNIDSYTVVKATSESAGDGSITVNATSSHGTIKVALSNFNYATEGNPLSGGQYTFSDLIQGEYTVYAKDARGCIDTQIVRVGWEVPYGVRWRLAYNDINETPVRVDILERDYAGAITEVTGETENPFILKYSGEGETKFKQVVPSFATINLVSDTNFQFLDLFTQDERKFKVIWYKNYGAGFVSKWTGFVTPTVYSEPFHSSTKYPVQITATDGLADLKTYDFIDKSGNIFRNQISVLKAICEILYKLDVDSDVRVGVNIYETTMSSGAGDDPLAQAYIDPIIFYNDKLQPKKCDEVLDALLLPFGARVFQSNGYWWIMSIDENDDEFDYRQFDIDGEYVSNGTYDPVKTMPDDAIWTNQSQLLNVIGNYGRIVITHKLHLDNTVFTNGTFEEHDLGDNGFFKNWTFFIGQNDSKYGLEKVSNGNSTGAFFCDFEQVADTPGENQLVSAPVTFEFDEKDRVKLTFQYLLRPLLNVSWVRFAYEAKLTIGADDYYLNPEGKFSKTASAATRGKIYIYASTYRSFQNFEIDAPLPVGSGSGTLQVRFYMDAQYGHDFSTTAAFKTGVATTNMEQGDRKYTVLSGDDQLRYTLKKGTEAESLPDVVHPSDFHATNNPKYWALEDRYLYYVIDPVTGQESVNFPMLDTILLDNVRVEYLPDGEQPIDEYDVSRTIDERIKNNLEFDALLGDLPTDVLNAATIYRGYFRKSNGVATDLWSRPGVTESRRILDILSILYAGQFSAPVWKLTGQVKAETDIGFIDCFHDTIASQDKKYLNMMMEIYDHTCEYNIEIHQLQSADTVGSFSDGFSDGFQN